MFFLRFVNKVITNTNLYLLWAYSSQAGSGSGTALSYPQHTQAGSASVNFFTGNATVCSLEFSARVVKED